MSDAVPARRIWALSQRRRKFLREVGSVVLGVLIALTAAEAVESLRWRWRVETTLKATDQELAQAMWNLEERVFVQRCLDRRLAQLRRIALNARDTGRLPAIGDIGLPPSRTFMTDAWSMAVGMGTPQYMSTTRAAQLTRTYSQIEKYRDRAEAEWGQWASLAALSDAAGRAPDDLIADALLTISELQRSSHLNRLIATQASEPVRAQLVSPGYFAPDALADARRRIVARTTARPICGPLIVDGRPYPRVPVPALQ